MVFDDYSLFV